VDPVQVLERALGVFFETGFIEFAAYGGALEVIGLVDIFVGRKDWVSAGRMRMCGKTIVDNDEMDFSASHFHSVEAIELRDEGVRIGFHVLYCQYLVFDNDITS
jgi:hypothetical protein